MVYIISFRGIVKNYQTAHKDTPHLDPCNTIVESYIMTSDHDKQVYYQFYLFKMIVEPQRIKLHFTRVSKSFCELKRKKAINFVTYFCWGEIGSTQQYNQLPAKQRKRQRMRETVTLQYTFLYYLGR